MPVITGSHKHSGVQVLSCLTLAFIFLGAHSYAEDVAVIESEMVVTAKWVAENLPPDALIAAHDIGALGYFDDHRIDRSCRVDFA